MTTALDGVLRRILESACEEHQANLSQRRLAHGAGRSDTSAERT